MSRKVRTGEEMKVEFSETEIQMLNALADGAKVTEMAPYLDLFYTKWDIRRMMEILRGKMGAKTCAQAVAIALREGVIK